MKARMRMKQKKCQINSVEDSYQHVQTEEDKFKLCHQGNSQGIEKWEYLVKDTLILEDVLKNIELKGIISRG